MGVSTFVSLAKQAWELPYYSTTLEMMDGCEVSIDNLQSPYYQEKIQNELLEYDERNKLYSFTLAFTGLGEYTYENTIKRVVRNITDYVESRTNEVEKASLIDSLKSLQQEKITLCFDYYDMVETANHLSKNRMIVAKPAGQSFENTQLEYLYQNEMMMDYSAKNLKNIMGCDCIGTEPEFLHLLIEGLIQISEEDSLPEEEYQALIALRQLYESGQLSHTLREDISQEIASVSGDADMVVIDKDDLDLLRNSDLREVICDYWQSISRLEELAV
ncbi:TPA: hypothetical protein U1C40_001674 [Streptococcus suis]|nr:hypothetical protein [Streptococcus suis]HEM3649024.1 hypothetical protein [Streptococcus suis]